MIKYTLFTLLLVCSIAHSARSQSVVKFSENGLATALQDAKAAGKPVFFMCYASWCSHCAHMKKEVFTDSAVASFFNTNFVCAAQDMEKGEGVKLNERLRVKGFPTFVIFDSKGTLLYRVSGDFSKEQILEQGKAALDPHKQLPYLHNQFAADTTNAAKCLEYIRALKRADMRTDGVVRRYFSTQSDAQLLTDTSWRILAWGVDDVTSREFQFLLSHLKAYDTIASPERVERKIAFVANEVLQPLASDGDSATYFTTRKYVSSTGLYKVDSTIFMADIALYEKRENWKAYAQATQKYADVYLQNNLNKMRDVVEKYLQFVDDPQALKHATKWTQSILDRRPEYAVEVLGAKLYLKLNDKEHAVAMAKKAKEIAGKFGMKTDEADKIINQP